jgi:hypothetical protein
MSFCILLWSLQLTPLPSRPYVYSVFAHDPKALKHAVKAALDNPIESYIPEYMTFDSVCARTAELLNMDWKGKGRKILRGRIAAGEGAVSNFQTKDEN